MIRPGLLTRTSGFLRSNLLGLVAVFIVLGGTAVALPGKNRVNSGDIKQGAVRTLDLRRGAVTKSKLRRNAVDGTRVRNNTLTTLDIDESTLDLPLAAGSVTEREEADRERRIVFGAGELAPGSEDDPEIKLNFAMPAAFFDPTEDDSAGAITEVPLDRAAGSAMEVRLLWDANETGQVVWGVRYRTQVPGASVSSGSPLVNLTSASSPAADTSIETAVLTIPGNAIQNGQPLAVYVLRDADATGDTLPAFARLRLVEIRYTATG